MRRTLFAIVLLSSAVGLLSAQQTRTDAPVRPTGAQTPPGTPTFRAETRLQVYNVFVTDKDGKAVEGLKKEDFVITENGVKQEIAFVEFQRIADEAPTPATPAAIEPAAPLTPAERTLTSRITVPPAGDTRFQDKRLLVFFFDLGNMGQADRLRAFDSSMKYLRTNMGPSDLLAILALQNGAVRIRQDFTDDRPRLLEVLTTMMYNDDLDQDGIPDLDVFSSDFGQNGGEFNLFNTDRRLSAIQTAVTALRPITQQKAMIYFGSGLNTNGADNAAQYQATINAARKANVAISAIDTRGLVAMSPSGDASRQSPGGMSMFNGQMAVNTMNGFVASQDGLYALAKDTGGKALLDYNDLGVGIVNAAKTITSYYMIGYYVTNNATDGKFRRVSATLADNTKKYEIAGSPGYNADKTWANFTSSDRDRQLEEAFMLEDPLTDMTIVMELNVFKLNSAEYYIPVSVKIPGSELQIARKRNVPRTEMDFMSEIKDCNKITYANMRDRLVIPLSEDVAGQLATRPIQYSTGFTLLPGCYMIKLAARDTVTGRVGTYQAKFNVANLEKEQTALPISTVVLSSQRVAVGDELFKINNSQAKKADLVDPLIFDNQRLVPSVTRVFSKSRDLFVYLQAYELGATTQRPLATFASIYKGGEKVLDTPTMAITGGMDDHSKAVPMRFSMSLASLEPGEYECQVTVLDPMTQKANFWRAPIRIVQ
jgi:VWFA-related protein